MDKHQIGLSTSDADDEDVAVSNDDPLSLGRPYTSASDEDVFNELGDECMPLDDNVHRYTPSSEEEDVDETDDQNMAVDEYGCGSTVGSDGDVDMRSVRSVEIDEPSESEEEEAAIEKDEVRSAVPMEYDEEDYIKVWDRKQVEAIEFAGVPLSNADESVPSTEKSLTIAGLATAAKLVRIMIAMLCLALTR